jgi:hypothetical protein
MIVDTILTTTNRMPSLTHKSQPDQKDLPDGEDPDIDLDNLEVWRTFKQWARCVEKARSESGDNYLNGEDFRVAFIDALFQDHVAWYSKMPYEFFKNMGGSFNKWYAEMLGKGGILSELLDRFHVEAGDYQSGIEDPYEREREDMQNSLWLDDSDMVPTFHERAWMASADQSFFISQNGYMGSVEGAVHEGDVVALISGFDMPAVLTPVEGVFRFTAYGYVHGLMHGEAWSENQEDRQRISLV